MINDEVCTAVLGAEICLLTEIIALNRTQRPGDLSRMPAHRRPFRAPFARAGQDRVEQRGGQAITWRRV